MGNEISAEDGQHYDRMKKGNAGLRRSNSLKETQAKSNDNNLQRDKAKGSTSVTRSSTFTSASLKKPVIFQKSDNSNKPSKSNNMKTNNSFINIVEKNNNNLAQTRESTMFENTIAEVNDEFIKTKLKNGHKKDNEFVVFTSPFSFKKGVIKKKKFESQQLNMSNATQKETVNQRKVSVETVNEVAEILSEDKQPIVEEMFVETSNESSKSRRNSEEVLKISGLNTTKVDLTELKSSSELMITPVTPEPSKVEVKEEKKRAITRRKNKYVRRSQSMKSYHELLPKLLSSDGLDPLANFHEFAEGESREEVIAREIRKAKLGPRRISDTCLVKEHHVNKSERYTQMLKELREKALSEIRPLSPYALDLFDKKEKEKTEDRRFKFEKNRDYFDSWLKDQNERISNLERACKEDNEFAKLRQSFRERKIKMPQTDLLPQRPHSVKLPRRYLKAENFYDISDTDDDDDEPSSTTKLKKKSLTDGCIKYFNNSTQLTDFVDDNAQTSETSQEYLSRVRFENNTKNVSVYDNEFFKDSSSEKVLDQLNHKVECDESKSKKLRDKINGSTGTISTDRKNSSNELILERNEILQSGNSENKNNENEKPETKQSTSPGSNSCENISKTGKSVFDENNNHKAIVEKHSSSISLYDRKTNVSVKNIVSKLNNIGSTKIKISSRQSYPNVSIKSVSARNEIFLRKDIKKFSQSASPILSHDNAIRNIAIVKPLQINQNQPNNNNIVKPSK